MNEEKTFKLECANCKLEQELPENISLARLNEEAHEFFKKHSTKIGDQWCNKSHIFIRTYRV